MADQFTVLQTSSRAPDLADPFSRAELGEDAMAVRQAELVRLAIVAAGVGARFERERIPHDPVAWLLAPRARCSTASALTACLGETAFEQALVLHADGAGLGLDADPRFLDQLLADETDGHAAEVDADEEMVAGGGPRPIRVPQKSSKRARGVAGRRTGRRSAIGCSPPASPSMRRRTGPGLRGGRGRQRAHVPQSPLRALRCDRCARREGAEDSTSRHDQREADLRSRRPSPSVLAVEPGAPTAEGFRGHHGAARLSVEGMVSIPVEVEALARVLGRHPDFRV